MFGFFKNMWNKNVAGKLSIIAGALIIVLAVAGIIYGVATQEGDLTFMKKEGHELHWTKINTPVQCTYDPTKLKTITPYSNAIGHINMAIGFTLYSPCIPWQLPQAMPEHMTGQITLHEGIPAINRTVTTIDDKDPGGVTDIKWDKRDGTILSASVRINVAIESKYIDRAWQHELLHAVGLDHDRMQSSIMYTALNARAGKLSKRDIKSLKEAYGAKD
jgi:hypothetical protein